MKQLILAVSLVFAILHGNAQQIEMKKTFGGYTFSKDGKHLNMKNLAAIMQPNKEAYTLIKSARSNNTLAMVLGGVGGFMAGYSLGSSLRGKEVNWTLLGIGAGAIGVGIPISISANKKTKQAVALYNKGLDKTSYFKPKFKIITNQKGIGLVMNF
ncbi:MAG: hypothetical protein L3J20_10000 [Flavobacteriaceae bacterium]|nr:hypothetical protein [Flavobacteriaceae bacterium]